MFQIGVDIEQVTNIKDSIEKSERFGKRVFTVLETQYCEIKPKKYQHYAGRFAAKEAVMKALGKGWLDGIQWVHIEILNNKDGKPQVILHKKANEIAISNNIQNISISISHTEHCAVAMALLSGK